MDRAVCFSAEALLRLQFFQPERHRGVHPLPAVHLSGKPWQHLLRGGVGATRGRGCELTTAQCTTAQNNGSATCLSCDPGEFVVEVSPGIFECLACLVGEVPSASELSPQIAFLALTQLLCQHAAECVPCPAGRVARAGDVLCRSCLSGTFANSSRQGACTSCPAGFIR